MMVVVVVVGVVVFVKTSFGNLSYVFIVCIGPGLGGFFFCRAW